MSFTVYKVVREVASGVIHKTEFVSAVVKEPGQQLTYRLGETTRGLPGSLGVFVFEQLEDAQRFARGNDRPIILECISEVAPLRPAKITNFKRVLETIQVYAGKKASWSRRVKWVAKFVGLFTCDPPLGTFVVPAVTPIRKLS